MAIELRRVMAISEVAATDFNNVPYRITLKATVGLSGEKSTLVLNQEAADRLNFPVSLDMVGKKILCVLESGESDDRRRDGLLIVSLTSTEALKPVLFTPPEWSSEHTRSLALASSIGVGIHGESTPCPFYHFVVSVNEEEFEAIRGLPVTTRFGFSLQMFGEGDKS